MTEATKFRSWQKAGEPGAAHAAASPNLTKIAAFAKDRMKIVDLS